MALCLVILLVFLCVNIVPSQPHQFVSAVLCISRQRLTVKGLKDKTRRNQLRTIFTWEIGASEDLRENAATHLESTAVGAAGTGRPDRWMVQYGGCWCKFDRS